MITIDCLNNMMDDTKVKIRQAVEKLTLLVTDEQINQWVNYLVLLRKWNKIYNMTSITDWNEMLVKHLFDSLSVARFIKGQQVIDVGSGGGLPGVPLAILMSEKHFVLIDSVGKKIRFLNHVKKALSLQNITPINIRIESYQPKTLFDTIISRAFSSVGDFYHLCHHLVANDGQLIAMKGADLELTALENLNQYFETFEVNVPLLEAKRHVIRITKQHR